VSARDSWRAVAWSAVAAAVLGWFLAPQPEPAAALVKVRNDRWELPALPRVFDQTTLAANVLGAPYWGAPLSAAVASAPPADPRWRLAGIFGQGQERGVLIEFIAEGRSPLRLRAGDALPSGHRIERIDEREVCVRIGARLYRLGVERVAS
jgi:hypothetical protein